MEVNPGWSVILGVIVWLLALGYKYLPVKGWEPDSRRMVGIVTGLSVALGLAQCVYEAQITPLPAMPAALPELVFEWIPNVVAWVALTVGAVFSVSQGVYAAIRKVILGKA